MTGFRPTLARNAPRLVWTLAGLGIAGCLLCFALLTGVFSRVARLETQSAELATHARNLITHFGSFTADLHEHLSSLLDPTNADDHPVDAGFRKAGERLLDDIAAVQDHSPEAATITLRFQSLQDRYLTLHDQCVTWAELHRRLEASAAATLAQTLDILGRYRSALSSEQGRLRLQRLRDLREYRAAAGEQAARLAEQLLSPARETPSSSVEAELSDLSLYAQQLSGELRADRIASLRENSIRPALARLEQALTRFHAALADLPAEDRSPHQHLEQLLVGDQGLAALAEHQSLAATEFRALDHRVNTLTADLRATADLVTGVLADTQTGSNARMARTLGLARLTSSLLLAGLACSTILLARRISASLRDQAGTLQAANARLDQALALANAANQAKTDFLANMSHEIRTPMTAILGFAELLADPSVPAPDRDAHAATICRQGRHLLAIINDILDLSKVESGNLAPERLPTAPLAVLDDLRALFRERAREKSLRLDVSASWPFPASFTSDPLRLRQILINLVGNAIKFTPAGTVRLHAEFDQNTRTLRFHVQDTGLGMSPDQLARLFKPFTQADETMSRRFGGTGLGLFLSKRLAEGLGGHIHVESTPGHGSTFTLELPIPEPVELLLAPPTAATSTATTPAATAGISTPAPGCPQIPARPLQGLRILLAEDGPDNQRLISYHLKKAGASVQVAENGRLAADLALAQPFDLILMDMQMPEMDGYAATTLLRTRGCTLPIIALTAHAMLGDRERCLAAGCSDYLTKPVDRALLIRACSTRPLPAAAPDQAALRPAA